MQFVMLVNLYVPAEGEIVHLKEWQVSHQRFIEDNGGFSEDMLLTCEQFELIPDINLQH